MSFRKLLLAALLLAAAACGSAADENRNFIDDSTQSGNFPSVGTTSSNSGADEQTTEIEVPPLPEVPTAADDSGFDVVEESTPSSSTALSNRAISWFLWKPVSDSNGNVVVLVDPPGVVVIATGSGGSERLTDYGPSNDRGTTARGSVPGCRFGQDVIVEFYDSQGRIVPLVNGAYRVRVPDGCERNEFRL